MLEIHMRGLAACQIYRPAAAEQIFSNLLYRQPEIRVRLPYNAAVDNRAMEHNLRPLLPGRPYPAPEGSYAAERVGERAAGPRRPAPPHPR